MKATCPSCGIEVVYGEHSHYPFCSRKCRNMDFLAWTEEKRTISTPLPGDDLGEDEETV